MMPHQYSKKFKNNRTATPLIVGRMVFHSLSKAEDYCVSKGLDPDKDIEWDNTPEFKTKAEKMAKQAIATLKAVEAVLESRKAQLNRDKDLALKQWEAAKASRDLLTDHYHNQLDQAIAQLTENYESHKLVFDMLEELYKITRWRE